MSTATSVAAKASVVATCLSITRTSAGYVAACTFSQFTGPLRINDKHSPPPVHVLSVRGSGAIEITFSIDQTALPPGYSSVEVAGFRFPEGSPLQALSNDTLYDPNGTIRIICPFDLLLTATPNGSNDAIAAVWDPGIENDGPP